MSRIAFSFFFSLFVTQGFIFMFLYPNLIFTKIKFYSDLSRVHQKERKKSLLRLISYKEQMIQNHYLHHQRGEGIGLPIPPNSDTFLYHFKPH